MSSPMKSPKLTEPSRGATHYSSSAPRIEPDEHLREVFDKVFFSLRHLSQGAEVFIGLCSPASDHCIVNWASGPFAALMNSSVNTSSGPMNAALTRPESAMLFSGGDLADLDPRLSSVRMGHAALFRVDLSGDGSAIICYWQPPSEGRIEPEKVSALRALAEVTSMAACSSDLAQDVQAQQLHLETMRDEMREIQQFYRQFSQAISQCFWVLDLLLRRVLVVSDNFERVWGASRRILAQDGLTGFMASVFPADRDRVLSEFHTHLGGTLDIELRVIDEVGEVRWIWLRAFPTDEASDGQAQRIVLIADDITEKKQQEELVRAQEAELVSRSKMLAVGELASGVAHEINNPLTIIVGKAAEVKRLMNHAPIDAKAICEHADKIQQTSIRISEIVASLKSLSKSDNKVVLKKTPFSEVFDELADMCKERFRAHGVHLEFPELPSGFSSEMNVTMISQLMLNLINNAFDAVQNESEKWVKIEWAEDEHSAYLYVTDSGSGIPIRIRSRIFDPFFTTKEPSKGTGLGLSLASSIASHHNGSVRLDHMNPHTRFVVQLPKRQRPVTQQK